LSAAHRAGRGLGGTAAGDPAASGEEDPLGGAALHRALDRAAQIVESCVLGGFEGGADRFSQLRDQCVPWPIGGIAGRLQAGDRGIHRSVEEVGDSQVSSHCFPLPCGHLDE